MLVLLQPCIFFLYALFISCFISSILLYSLKKRRLPSQTQALMTLQGTNATTDLSRASSGNVTFLRRHIYQPQPGPWEEYRIWTGATWASLFSILKQFIAMSLTSAKASRGKYAPECPPLHVFMLLFPNTMEATKPYNIFSGSS